MSDTEQTELIDHYAAGYDAVLAAIEGITEREWDNQESVDEWSARDLIHHYAESEMVAAVRLRRLIAEDEPVIVPYDEKDYARKLFYDRPIEPSLQAFRYALQTNVAILRRIPDEMWTKGGLHPETGPYDLNRFVEMYCVHGAWHADQFARARSGQLNCRVEPVEAERSDELTRLIERYEGGHQAVLDALAGIGDDELDRPEAPDEWSPRQVAHHLADSETISVMRFRRVLVEDDPLIQGYDQEQYAARLFYDRPIEDSLALFRYARETAALILRRLPPADWRRTWSHSEYGPSTVVDWLAYYAEHPREHADQIRRARAANDRRLNA